MAGKIDDPVAAVEAVVRDCQTVFGVEVSRKDAQVAIQTAFERGSEGWTQATEMALELLTREDKVPADDASAGPPSELPDGLDELAGTLHTASRMALDEAWRRGYNSGYAEGKLAMRGAKRRRGAAAPAAGAAASAADGAGDVLPGHPDFNNPPRGKGAAAAAAREF
eukprot:gene2182-22278_t